RAHPSRSIRVRGEPAWILNRDSAGLDDRDRPCCRRPVNRVRARCRVSDAPPWTAVHGELARPCDGRRYRHLACADVGVPEVPGADRLTAAVRRRVLASVCRTVPPLSSSPQRSAAAYGRPRPAEVSVLPSPNAHAAALAWMRS